MTSEPNDQWNPQKFDYRGFHWWFGPDVTELLTLTDSRSKLLYFKKLILKNSIVPKLDEVEIHGISLKNLFLISAKFLGGICWELIPKVGLKNFTYN